MKIMMDARSAKDQARERVGGRSVGKTSDPHDGMVTVEVLDSTGLADRLYGPEPMATALRRATRERCARRQMDRWGVPPIDGMFGLPGRKVWAQDLVQAAIDDPARNVSRRRPARDGGGPGGRGGS